MPLLEVPDPSLILLVGPAGVGKTTFAHAYFRPTQIVSSDACRALVADDESDQSATGDAFRVVHLIAALRLARRRLTVIDATNLLVVGRRPLLDLAREHGITCVAIVFDLPLEVSLERARRRTDRRVVPAVVRMHHGQLHRRPPDVTEGFERIWVLRSPEEVAAARITRRPPP